MFYGITNCYNWSKVSPLLSISLFLQNQCCQQFIQRRVLLNLISSKVYQNKLTEATVIIRSADRTVGIVTRLRTGRSGFRIPKVARDFSHLQNVQICSGAHPASCLMATGVLPGGIKRSVHKINLSLPSSAEVTKQWSYTSTPHFMTSWHVQEKD
jgi:hypothetical protein